MALETTREIATPGSLTRKTISEDKSKENRIRRAECNRAARYQSVRDHGLRFKVVAPNSEISYHQEWPFKPAEYSQRFHIMDMNYAIEPYSEWEDMTKYKRFKCEFTNILVVSDIRLTSLQ